MNIITERAAKCLDLLAAGMPKKQLAEAMDMSCRNVEYALTQAKIDAKCKTTYQLIAEYSKGQIAVKGLK